MTEIKFIKDIFRNYWFNNILKEAKMNTSKLFSILSVSMVTVFASSANASLVISEIMYNPLSPESDWEWVEVYNPDASAVDLSGWVADDGNSFAVSTANVGGGVNIIDSGEFAVLYNADILDADTFENSWGFGINLIPVSQWNALNNTGDKFGLWSSFTAYSGDHETHIEAVVSVTYQNVSPWPVNDGKSSIYLTNLTADASNGANWALTPSELSYTSLNGDVGTPGYAGPAVVPVPAAVWLFGSGLIGLIGIARRRKA